MSHASVSLSVTLVQVGAQHKSWILTSIKAHERQTGMLPFIAHRAEGSIMRHTTETTCEYSASLHREEDLMPMNKPHLEFHRLDMDTGWATPAGYPSGIQQKILASDINEGRKTGSRSRLLRFEPGVYTTAPFVHDHWEE